MSYLLPPEASDMSSIVKMFGPSLSDPSKIVNRDVPLRDVPAFSRAGFQKGSVPEPIEEIVERTVEAKLEPKTKAKKK